MGVRVGGWRAVSGCRAAAPGDGHAGNTLIIVITADPNPSSAPPATHHGRGLQAPAIISGLISKTEGILRLVSAVLGEGGPPRASTQGPGSLAAMRSLWNSLRAPTHLDKMKF